MLPTIRDGDWVFVVPGRSVRAGDVAVIDRNGAVTVHRILSRRLGLEMGDGCARARRFGPNEVVGKVVAFARGERTVDLTDLNARLRGGVWTLRGLSKVARRKLRLRSRTKAGR